MAVEPVETVDRLLWLIDVYDIKTGCASAVHQLLMSTYHSEQERVPGILPRWTKTMMTWVTTAVTAGNGTLNRTQKYWHGQNPTVC